MDDGASWQTARSALGYAVTADTFKLSRGLTYDVMVAYCMDTITQSVTVPDLVPLYSSIGMGSSSACSPNYAYSYPNNALGDSLTIEMLTGPPGAPTLPTVTVATNNIYAPWSTSLLSYGTYTFRITDSVGTQCPRYIVVTASSAQNPLTVNALETNIHACNGKSGISFTLGDVNDSATVEMLSAPPGVSLTPVFKIKGYTVYPWLLRSLPLGTYTFRLADSIGAGAGCPRFCNNISVTIQHPMGNPFEIKTLCNRSLEITDTTRYVDQGIINPQMWHYNASLMRLKMYDSAGNLVFGGNAGAVSSGFVANSSTLFSIPASTIDSLPFGQYTVRIFTNTAKLPFCEFVDQPYIKSQYPIDLSNSLFVAGCDGSDAAASISVVAKYGNPPYIYNLYRNQISSDSLLIGGQLTPIFNNLDTGTVYYIQVADACGFGGSQVMLAPRTEIPTFIKGFSSMPCPGSTVTFLVGDFPGITYQWYKNDVAIAGATAPEYTLVSASTSDSGAYRATLSLDSCVVLTSAYILDVNLCGTPLGIQLVSFKGSARHGDAVLEWKTFSESNNSGFNVEHSIDGRNWSDVGFVKSQALSGSSTEPLSYRFVHKNAGKGMHYYRLMQTDLNGKKTSSSIVKILFKDGAASYNVYPNPTTGLVQVTGLKGGEHIVVSGVSGNIYKQATATSAQQNISLSGMMAGVYILSVSDKDGHVEHYKISKL